MIIRALTGRLDLDALEQHPTDVLSLNDIGAVDLVVAEPLPVLPYAASRHGGAFLLLDPATATRWPPGSWRAESWPFLSPSTSPVGVSSPSAGARSRRAA